MGTGVRRKFYDSTVVINNCAHSGQSTRTFIDNGYWDAMKKNIKPGDYVLIQFGHNDQDDAVSKHTEIGKEYVYKDSEGNIVTVPSYETYLARYVSETEALGAIPVIVTSITRRLYLSNPDTMGGYPQAAKTYAQKRGIACIDMYKYSTELLSSLGDEKSKELYLWLDAKDSRYMSDPQYAADSNKLRDTVQTDNSHFTYYGARIFASEIARQLGEKFSSLAGSIKKN